MKRGKLKSSVGLLPLALSMAIAPVAPSWAQLDPTTSRAAPAIAGPEAALAIPPDAAAAVGAVVEGYPPPVCAAPPISGPIVDKKPPSNVQPHRAFPATWQKVLDSFTANGRIPGAVIIVKSPDWGVRVGTTGYADLATKTPIAPDMQFRVGSVSKVFTAQTILQMEQEGKLKLTDPVLKYLGDDNIVAGIPYINEMTIGMLLQMTTGITNYLGASNIGWSPQVTPQRQFDSNELMAVLSNNGPSPPLAADFAPGATYPNPYWETVFEGQPPEPVPAPYPFWYYSNSNYILLGKIAEKISGLKAEQVIQQYVMDKLGMQDTFFATNDQQLPQMHGYTKWGAIPYPEQVYDTWCDVTAINPSYAWTAGAIVSTPWDLLKLEDSMFKSDLLLNQGTKEKWFTFVSADIHIGWEPMDYGVGALMQPARSYGSARGHGGAFPGYKTLLYYFFDSDISFVLASNTWDQSWEVAMLDSIMPLVSSAVTTPQPAENGQVIPINGLVDLGWQAGRIYGSSYNVYWGTDADKVDQATPDSHDGVELTNVPGVTAQVTLQPGTTYYWRVDTVAEGQLIPLVNGPLWSFTTSAAK